jgi:hypothetical protein
MKTNNEFDGLKKIKQVDAPPFLLTRIKNRIDSLTDARAPVQWTWSLAAAAVVVLAINMGVVLSRANTTEKNTIADVVNTMQLSTNNDFYHD